MSYEPFLTCVIRTTVWNFSSNTRENGGELHDRVRACAGVNRAKHTDWRGLIWQVDVVIN